VVHLSRWQRWTSRLVWTYLALIGLISALVQWTGDSWWFSTVLLFGPRWIWMLPLPLLVLMVLVSLGVARQRLLLLPLLIAAVLLVWPIMGWIPGLGHSGATESADLRVLTYNIGTDDASAHPSVSMSNLTWLVSATRADVAAFQECNFSDEQLRTAFPEYEVSSTADTCLISRFVVAKTAIRDRADIRALHGSGIIDRFEIIGPRGLLSVTSIHLATVRRGMEQVLDHPSDVPAALRNNIRLRSLESREARAWSARTKVPQIVVGDFNIPQESQIYRTYWSGLANALAECGSGFAYTKFTGNWGIRIDHVLYDSSWACTSASVLSGLGGDHRPVFVTLRLQ